MIRNIKLTIEYDGTNYAGWQYQDNAVSIQDVVEKAISKVVNTKIRLNGASRTDSGVHALGQVANFKTDSQIELYNLKRGINCNLPKDINILDCEEAKETFHARFDAKKKYYRYVVSRIYSPIHRFYSYSFTYNVSIEILRETANYLIGEHDFTSFTQYQIEDIRTVRSIDKIEIIEKNDFIYFDFEAQSFLKKMIRVIVGTLLEMASKKIPPEEILKIIDSRNRNKAGDTVPGKGLFLMKIYY